MKVIAKRITAQISSFVIGASAIAGYGAFVFTQNTPNITHVAPVYAQETAAVQASPQGMQKLVSAVEYAENMSARTVTALQLPKARKYKKAKLEDYRMLLKVDKKKSQAEKDAEKKFDAVYELDTTTIYDPHPDALNFTDTRSVKDEYYTVDDIISGNQVTLNAHELLCQAVYSEIGSDWDENAIKAQVVAAYSYLRFNDSIDRVPTVGLKQNYPEKIEKCVSAVEGQAVYYDGEIINAVYSASTAGYSIESERIWEVYYPYLRAVVSEYDNEDPNYGLEYKFTEDEVRSILQEKLGLTLSDNVKNWFSMEDIYSGKYIGYVNIDGQETITARTMQEIFDLKSQAFTVSYDNGEFLFKSFGWGHGVGMSQWGACLYAKHGWTYDQILRHYYLNTSLALSDENAKAVQRGIPADTPEPEQSTESSAEQAPEENSSQP